MSKILSSTTSNSISNIDINDIISIVKLPCHRNLIINDNNGNSIKVHSVIAACYSDVIKKFCQGTNDFSDGLTFPNCNYNELMFFSRFLEDKVKINLANVAVAVSVLCKFEIKLLKDQCLKFLETSNNLSDLKELLISHNELHNCSYYKEIISSNVSLIKNFLSSEFLEMNEIDLQNAPWVYCLFYWIPGDEAVKLVQQWIDFDKSRTTSDSLRTLYKYIDLTTLSNETIEKTFFNSIPTRHRFSTRVNNNKLNIENHFKLNGYNDHSNKFKHTQNLISAKNYIRKNEDKENVSCIAEFVYVPIDEYDREKQNMIYCKKAKSKVSKWVNNTQFSQASKSINLIEKEDTTRSVEYFYALLKEITIGGLENPDVYKILSKSSLSTSKKLKLTVRWVEKDPESRLKTLYSVWKLLKNDRNRIPEKDIRYLLVENETFLKTDKKYEIFATSIYDRYFL